MPVCGQFKITWNHLVIIDWIPQNHRTTDYSEWASHPGQLIISHLNYNLKKNEVANEYVSLVTKFIVACCDRKEQMCWPM